MTARSAGTAPMTEVEDVVREAAAGAAAAPLEPAAAPPVLTTGRGVAAPIVVGTRHRPRDYALRRMLAVTDLVAITVALAITLLATQTSSAGSGLVWGLVTLPVWLVIFKAYGLYDRDARRISHTTVDDIPWLFHAVLLGSIGLWAFYNGIVPETDIEFVGLLGFFALAMALVLAVRSITRTGTAAGLGHERVLILGDGPEVPVLVRKMRAHPEYALDPVAIVSGSAEHASHGADLPVVGTIDDIDFEEVVRRHGIDRVIVSRVAVAETDLNGLGHLEVVRRCRELRVKVSVLPQLFDAMGPAVEVDDVEGVTVLGINPPVLSPSSRLLKRGMDLGGSLLLLTVLAPVLALIAVAIKLDSRGPVLFTQTRIGKGGRRFSVLKFRTMIVGADRMQEELRAKSKDPNWLLLDHDPRVTRVGRFLRMTSLDELPQLWNVVRGQMSLVGPRPLIESEDQQLVGWRRTRIDLTPGLTGLWQVLGRTNIPFEEMIKIDYLYVTNWSLWNDVRLILRTVPVVVARKGAN